MIDILTPNITFFERTPNKWYWYNSQNANVPICGPFDTEAHAMKDWHIKILKLRARKQHAKSNEATADR